MNIKKMTVAATLTAVLTAFSGGYGEAKDIIHENNGYKLAVPDVYDKLVRTDTKQRRKDGRLFTVAEIASVQAAKSTGNNYDGAGALFSIGTVNGTELHKMLCRDMSGAEVFAKDDTGKYYVYYHPTDVRFMRENNDAMKRDQNIWGELNEWAWRDVRNEFVKNNPTLTAKRYDNSSVGIYLAQTAYEPNTEYTVSSLQYGTIVPQYVPAAHYVNRLITDVTYKMADANETPDGEYVVVNFPKQKVRLDFFLMSGKENYVRETTSDGRENLYRAEFDDKTIKASAIAQEWYDELAASRDMAKLGYTPDSLAGRWAEKIAGRGNIEITRSQHKGQYDVKISWSNSAFETCVWTMTARASASNILSYDNCRHTVVTFTSEDSSTEKVVYENGTGCFVLNSAHEIMWQDDMAGAGDNTVFVGV